MKRQHIERNLQLCGSHRAYQPDQNTGGYPQLGNRGGFQSYESRAGAFNARREPGMEAREEREFGRIQGGGRNNIIGQPTQL